MAWAKTRPSPRFDLAGSNVLTCSITDLPGASEALALSGSNDDGYAPLMDAIAARYGVSPSQVTTAQGTSGANSLVCAAMLEHGDEVLLETPGYDPLLGAPRLLGADIRRFQRTFADGWALDPARIEAAMTPRIRLIIVTPHNPTGTLADAEALRAVGRIAEKAGAHVLVDEVYLDASGLTRRLRVTRRWIHHHQQPGQVLRTVRSSFGLGDVVRSGCGAAASCSRRHRRDRSHRH